VSPQDAPVDVAAPPLTGPTLMHQEWRDLTFLHWAVDPDRVAGYFPPGTRPHLLDGVTYVGLVPFRMRDAGFGRRTSVPWAGTFLETNVRLYSIGDDGTPGVVFVSLDTDRALVVASARAGFAVPYRWAQMSYAVSAGGAHPGQGDPTGEEHTYAARLRWGGHGRGGAGAAALREARRRTSLIRVRVGERRDPDARDHFLTSRWGLHTHHLGQDWFVPNEHGPWPLHDAEVLLLEDHLAASVGLGDVVAGPPDHVAFSRSVTTRFGLPRRVTSRLGPGGPRTLRDGSPLTPQDTASING